MEKQVRRQLKKQIISWTSKATSRSTRGRKQDKVDSILFFQEAGRLQAILDKLGQHD